MFFSCCFQDFLFILKSTILILVCFDVCLFWFIYLEVSGLPGPGCLFPSPYEGNFQPLRLQIFFLVLSLIFQRFYMQISFCLMLSQRSLMVSTFYLFFLVLLSAILLWWLLCFSQFPFFYLNVLCHYFRFMLCGYHEAYIKYLIDKILLFRLRLILSSLTYMDPIIFLYL